MVTNVNAIACIGEHATGLCGEVGEEFNAIDLAGQFGEQGGLVPRAGANLQDPFRALQAEGREHVGHDVRLRDGLLCADGQRVVGIRVGAQGLRDIAMPWDAVKRLEYARIANAALAELLAHHGAALVGVGSSHRALWRRASAASIAAAVGIAAMSAEGACRI